MALLGALAGLKIGVGLATYYLKGDVLGLAATDYEGACRYIQEANQWLDTDQGYREIIDSLHQSLPLD